MTENRRSAVKPLTRTGVVRSDDVMLASFRIRFVASLIAICATVLALALLAVALMTHRRGLTGAGTIVLALAAASNAVPEGTRIWLALYLGRWIGPKQKPVWRDERPAWFWFLTGVHATFAVIYLVVALALLWLWPELSGRL